jgi:hypothetical protein
MKPVGERIIFQLEKETEDEVVLSSGQRLYLETKFDRMRHARQYGIVVSVGDNLEACKIEHKDGIMLYEGDKVWMHHFAIEKAHRFEHRGEVYYHLPYSLFYAVLRDGVFLPLGEYVFVKPLRFDDKWSGIYDPRHGELSKDYGVVVFINDYAKGELGVDVGDVVRIKHAGAQYDMKIGGEVLYRVRMRQLEAVVDGKIEIHS